PPAGPHQPGQLPGERPRVLQVLDRLDGGDHVGEGVRVGGAAGVEVHRAELGGGGEPVVADRVGPGVVVEPPAEVRPQLAAAAADVEEGAAAGVPAGQRVGDGPVDRGGAGTEA